PPAKKILGSRKSKHIITVEAIFEIINSAQKNLRLVSPYFIPGPKGSKAFSEAARRGTNIGILTNSLAATDAIAAHSGAMKYRRQLIRRGIDLYELKPLGRLHKRIGILPKSRSSLHAKLIVADGIKSFVGSFNLDPRSAWLNCEAGIIVVDKSVAQALLAL